VCGVCVFCGVCVCVMCCVCVVCVCVWCVYVCVLFESLKYLTFLKETDTQFVS